MRTSLQIRSTARTGDSASPKTASVSFFAAAGATSESYSGIDREVS
ncbi:MAG: hypothetical protein U0792_13865 [Gemmataceae bacterium]